MDKQQIRLPCKKNKITKATAGVVVVNRSILKQILYHTPNWGEKEDSTSKLSFKQNILLKTRRSKTIILWLTSVTNKEESS